MAKEKLDEVFGKLLLPHLKYFNQVLRVYWLALPHLAKASQTPPQLNSERANKWAGIGAGLGRGLAYGLGIISCCLYAYEVLNLGNLVVHQVIEEFHVAAQCVVKTNIGAGYLEKKV